MSLKRSDKDVFNLHEGCVLWIIAVYCFLTKVLLQNHRLTVRGSYHFHWWMDHDIWGDYLSSKGKHQNFLHFHINVVWSRVTVNKVRVRAKRTRIYLE